MQGNFYSSREQNIKETDSKEEASFSKSNEDKEKLPKTALFDDEKNNSALISEAVNHNLFMFNPDNLYENIVNNYKVAKKLYGETLIRLVSGFNEETIERNINIPEFKKELKSRINSKITELKTEGLINEENTLTEYAYELSLINTYLKELDSIHQNPFGLRSRTKKSNLGSINEIVKFNDQSIKDIAIRDSIKRALKRSHDKIYLEDLSVYERVNSAELQTMIAIDASSSMRGEKMMKSKKAAVIFAYSSIKEHNSVGLIVFRDKVIRKIKPTTNLYQIIKEIATIQTTNLTNIEKAIKSSLNMFKKNTTKNLILITDAIPTKGEKPIEETINAAIQAKNSRINLSIVGIDLNKEGEKIAKEIVNAARGVLFVVKDLNDLDRILIEEYYSVKSRRSFV